MELRIAGVVKESIVDGKGIRYTVFTQGCPHHCKGCHNPQTWAFEGGEITTPEKLFADFGKNPLLKGITFSGGEPFCQLRQGLGLAEPAPHRHEQDPAAGPGGAAGAVTRRPAEYAQRGGWPRRGLPPLFLRLAGGVTVPSL